MHFRCGWTRFSLNDPGFAFLSAFVENKDVAGMTLRATMGNILGQADRFERTIFCRPRGGASRLHRTA